MKLSSILIIFFMMATSTAGVIAQGKLVFLNGKERRFETAEVKGDFIVYQKEGEKSNWLRRADRFNVFSIVHDNGMEEIIYDPDTTEGADPTVAEARDYIRGEQHAMEVYRKPMNVIGGTLAGVAGSVAGFYGIPVPIAYTTVVGQFTPRMPKAERNLDLPEAYIAGYQRKARNMKITRSLIGGGIGFGIGLTAFVLIFSD